MGILSRGPKAVARDTGGRTPLRYAAVDQKSDLVRELLAAGANPNDRDFKGFTPLHLAAQYDDLDVLRALLDAGADVNAVNDIGDTPLLVAVGAPWSSPEALRLLLQRGADPHFENHNGTSALAFINRIDNAEGHKEVFADLPDESGGPWRPQGSQA
ncbi:ankyrin repeat domain-containing protein [Nocardia otitidiscaviarum]|uniref:ankyrin repeat domain-containing protein n=1 Tax=Nocardia otitidiscaviarum TaxID=1823 RepID=UPI0018945CF0|nr:ankyrin repeat domain-containing protein [Nocardia otitidiscaviarum]MBF6239493.1 ankyrin repeat domain-containing protein [Nocardia otitidiscaviarum]